MAGGASLTLAAAAQAADLPTTKGAPPPPPATVASCTSFQDFLTTACPLTYYGITFYGTIDMGVGCDKFGAPWNPTAHFGDNYMISKAGRPNIYELAPNALSQSNVGVKVKRANRARLVVRRPGGNRLRPVLAPVGERRGSAIRKQLGATAVTVVQRQFRPRGPVASTRSASVASATRRSAR